MRKSVAGSAPADVCGAGSVGRSLVRTLALCIVGMSMMVFWGGEAEAQSYGGADIPPAYLQEYQETGAAYGIDWTILAAIGKVESGHGAGAYDGCILGPPTPYGPAYGPMQFLVSSWATLGVDGNGDGIVDSCNYQDAIPSSANYLLRSGAPEDYYSAIYAYNHSDLYVQQVLAEARKYYQVYVTGAY